MITKMKYLTFIVILTALIGIAYHADGKGKKAIDFHGCDEIQDNKLNRNIR